MIRIHLDAATRDELRALRRKALPPKVRDRIEMATLSDAGWSAPRTADHLGYCGQTVRDLLRDFLGRRTEALRLPLSRCSRIEPKCLLSLGFRTPRRQGRDDG
jgi:hypothetical protein